MPRDPQALLLPDALADTAAGKLMGVRIPRPLRGGEAERATMERLLRAAQVIELDRSAIRAAVAASWLPPTDMVRMLPETRLPHVPLWLEWDEGVRLLALRELGNAEAERAITVELPTAQARAMLSKIKTAQEGEASAAVRVGYLFTEPTATMRTQPDSEGFAYAGYPFVRSAKLAHVCAHPVGLAWGPESGAMPLSEGDAGARLLFGPAWWDAWKGDPAQRAAMRILGERCGLSIGPGLRLPAVLACAQHVAQDGSLPDDLNELATDGATNMTGDIRFLLAALWLWHRRIAAQAGGRAARWRRPMKTGWRHEPLTIHTLAVDLPRLTAPRPAGGEGGEGNGAPKRAHDVAGHWRRKRKNPGKAWVSPHRRGDEALGRVEKTYRATADRLAGAAASEAT